MNNGEFYDTTPTPHFMIGFARQKWTVAEAISEMIDNSAGRMRGNAKHIHVIWDSRKRILVVWDDGQGMDHIGRLFRLGDTIGHGPGDIGINGQGGTMALLWLASEVKIWTMRNGKVMRDHVVWKEWFDQNKFPVVGNKWEPASYRNTPVKLLEAKHGTYIELTLREERGSWRPGAVQESLAATYAPGLRRALNVEWTTIARGGQIYEQVLTPEKLEWPTDPTKFVEFNVNCVFKGETLPVTGKVALFEDISWSKSVVKVGFEHRVIMPNVRDCYRSSDPGNDAAYSGDGIAGWLDLIGPGWLKFLTNTKTEIDDAVLRNALMQHVFEKIEPLLKQTEEDRQQAIFDGLALELTANLNRLGEVKFKIGGKDDDIDDDDDTEPKPEKPELPDGPERKPREKKPENDADDASKRVPVTSIRIKRVSDDELKGGFCRMQVESDQQQSFVIELNKDHDTVAALLRSPSTMEKHAMYLIIVHEMAAELFNKPAILKRILPTKMFVKINALDDDDKSRVLARLFFDCARLPPLAEAAE